MSRKAIVAAGALAASVGIAEGQVAFFDLDGGQQGAFDAALASAEVAYVSEESLSSDIGAKLTDTTCGVITEEGELYDELGISTNAFSYFDDHVHITDDTHDITSGLGTGHLDVSTTDTDLVLTGGSIAPGLVKLAESHSSTNATLGVVEKGDTLVGAGPAAGRRVHLPWGASGFDVTSLNSNGLEIMRRSIEWAGEATLVRSVRVQISGVENSAQTVERCVWLVNHPEAP